ncbi:Clavaminate synthase-like protein [Artomyces pyxidatus]|uniref:Clavaminate synthase-like protein n=1 Tax=Artomyces pyxidatus TaxID=48021 RepID=A0ACB8SQA1_9AGAM|nr:Clavaminate synthase-like protein [Artomyces pyxidatus]
MTRFTSAELEDALSRMERFKGSESISSDSVEFGLGPTVPTFKKTSMSLSNFASVWARGEPLVVTDCVLQGRWTPEDLSRRHGTTKVKIVDCQTNSQTNSTLSQFFETFAEDPATRHTILKLKDWPPNDRLEDVLPDLYRAFEKGVPFPDYTTADGIYNLASHFPHHGVRPDLGPKMYIAHGTSNLPSEDCRGSTRLHLDLTSAVNLALYAGKTIDGAPGYALWHLFPPSSLGRVRDYIRKDVDSKSTGDPIHNQETYLTPSMLHVLAEEYGVTPYTIHQYPGQAVFIPAGCAHQVSNQADAIKIACDFISAENLDCTAQVWRELRVQRLVSQYGDDVLQLESCLWHAWNSLSGIREELEAEGMSRTPPDRAI